MQTPPALHDPGRRDTRSALAVLLAALFLVAAPGILAAQVPGGTLAAATTAEGAGGGDDVPTPEVARAFFERLTGLAGEWRAVSDKGWSGATTYEVIARGSVVMASTSFADAPGRKMVTMYSMDGDRLVATHYCEARNQPRLVAQEIDLEEGRAVFRFAGGGNLESRDQGHMDQAVIHLDDDHRLRSHWTWYQDGTERWLEQIELERRR